MPVAVRGKCLTCGCHLPTNSHGDHRHITAQELEAAAAAAGISIEQAWRNMRDTLHDMTVEAPSVQKVGPGGWSHGWVRGGFEILAHSGEPGDGWIRMEDGSPGPWGKYGAAGAALRTVDAAGQERFLMVRGSTGSDAGGKWQLPGGALDSLESPAQGAAREIHEELGATPEYLASLEPHGQHVFELPGSHGWRYTTIAATAPHPFQPAGHTWETADARWLTRQEIDQLDQQGQLIPPLSGGRIHANIISLFPPPATAKGHPYAGQRYTHGWVPVAEALHHFASGDVATALHEDGAIHVTVHPDGAAGHMHLHAEDVPSLVEGMDEAQADLESGRAHESTLLTTAGEVSLLGRPDSGLHIRHGDADLHLTPAEADQFSQHLTDLAATHQPQIVATHRVSPDLAFNVLANDRVSVTLGASSAPEPLLLDGSEAADVAAVLRGQPPSARPAEQPRRRWFGGRKPSPSAGEREPVRTVRIHPDLAVGWWSDGSATLDTPTTEVQIPAAHLATAAAVLQDISNRLGPVQTGKTARQARLLRKTVGHHVAGEPLRYRHGWLPIGPTDGLDTMHTHSLHNLAGEYEVPGHHNQNTSRDELLAGLRKAGAVSPAVARAHHELGDAPDAAWTGEHALAAAPARFYPDPKWNTGHVDDARLNGPPGVGSVNAIAEYQGVEFMETNHFLRHGPLESSPDDDYGRERDARAAARVAEIDKTMAVSPLSHDVVVQRVLHHGSGVFGKETWFGNVIDWEDYEHGTDRWAAGERPDLTGLEWREDAYVSTTANPAVAEHYVKRFTGGYFPDATEEANFAYTRASLVDSPTILNIRVPRGVGAVATSGWSDKQEAEITLQRGLRLRVTRDHGGVDHGGRYVRMLDAEVLT